MREYPILFSGPMIRAILADRKNVTRRLSSQWLKVKAGDRLWVRETFAPIGEHAVIHQATNIGYSVARWKPSIHMPRWASRILLECEEDARAESLQDITEEDAQREGVDKSRCGIAGYAMEPVYSYRTGFVRIWSTLHTKPGETWLENPTVIRVGAFRRIA